MAKAKAKKAALARIPHQCCYPRVVQEQRPRPGLSIHARRRGRSPGTPGSGRAHPAGSSRGRRGPGRRTPRASLGLTSARRRAATPIPRPCFAGAEVRMAFVSASFTLLMPTKAEDFNLFSDLFPRPFTPFLLQLPETRPWCPVLPASESGTASPRRAPDGRQPRGHPLAWFQGPSNSDRSALPHPIPPRTPFSALFLTATACQGLSG